MNEKVELLTTQKKELDALWKNILKNKRDAEIITKALGFPDEHALLDKIESLPLYLLKNNRDSVINITINVVSKEKPEFPEWLVTNITDMFSEANPDNFKSALDCIGRVHIYKAPLEWKLNSVIYEKMCILHNAICELYKYCSEPNYPYIFKCKEYTGKSIYEHLPDHDLDTIIGLMSYIYAYNITYTQDKNVDDIYIRNSARAYQILTDMLSNNRPYVLSKDSDLHTILPSDEELAESLK